ncbi:hypothetical protein AB9K35_07685 [Leisingera sp. XS_AS12]|uniref:hypothetical protein n=1 Tax=Leisingera sp. XS_AS12 TaxID=3241294 RepID=UPI0035155503
MFGWLVATLCLFSGLIGATASRIWPFVLTGLAVSGLLLAARGADLSAVAVLLITISAPLGWIARMVVSDLLEVYRGLGGLKLIRLLAMAAAYASLPLIAIYLAADAGRLRANTALYGCDEVIGAFEVPASGEILRGHIEGEQSYMLSREAATRPLPANWLTPLSSWACPPPVDRFDLEASLIKSIHAYAENIRRHLLARVDAAVESARANGDRGADATTSALFGTGRHCEGAIPPSLENCGIIVTETCPFYRWPFKIGECASREIQHTVQIAIVKAYEAARHDFKASWDDHLGAMYTTGENVETATKDAANAFLDLYLAPAEKRAVRSIKSFLAFWRFLSWALLAWSFAILIKIYLSLFARFAFTRTGGGLHLSIAPEGGSKAVHPDFSSLSKGGSVSIPINSDTWYVARSGVISWSKLHSLSRWPAPGRLMLRRALNGKLAWMKYDSSDTEVLTGTHDIRFPIGEIEIPPGARIVIDIARLEAFTSGVRFRTIFSARLAAVLRQRLIYTEAYGEGRILVSGVGGGLYSVTRGGEPDHAGIAAIVGMDSFGRFGCEAKSDPISVAINRPTIFPLDDTGSLLVSTTEPRGAGLAKAWLRSVTFFLFG